MTANTETERAEFEAWYIKSAQKAVPAFSAWSDIEVRDGCIRPDGESYKIDTARIAWEAWQAARRAPLVPQGLREAAQRAHDWMESQADSQSKGNHHSFDLFCLRQERDALAEALAAAPQPPEADHSEQHLEMVAAPVKLPEPVAWTLQRELDAKRTTTSGHLWFSNPVNALWTALYTEQQVRQLLATHGEAKR